jgi:hypothetical protein
MYPSGPNFPGLSEIQATQLRVREQRTSVKQPAEKIQNKFKKHHQVESLDQVAQRNCSGLYFVVIDVKNR